jgi:hypothetical protein
MGLDMYLNAKRYVSQFSDAEIGSKIANLFPELEGKHVNGVTVEAMYWRKANAVHKWFVDNVQEGVDDCGYYHVSREKLEQLRDLVLEVIETQNVELLPPTGGFFFGSTEIDEWYWEDMKNTAQGLANVLDTFDTHFWDFEYHSSW